MAAQLCERGGGDKRRCKSKSHVVVAAHRDPEGARGLAIHVVVSDAHSNNKLYAAARARGVRGVRGGQRAGQDEASRVCSDRYGPVCQCVGVGGGVRAGGRSGEKMVFLVVGWVIIYNFITFSSNIYRC